MPRFLRSIRVDEVSAVDAGAGRRVRVMLMKRDGGLYADGGALDPEAAAYLKREFSQDERDKLADKGHALPGGSFPIVNRGDLKNAIRAIGRAKDPAKAKAHIKSRAKALGATDELPDDWTEKNMPLAADVQKAIEEAVAKSAKELGDKHAAEIAKKDHEIVLAKMSEKHKAFHSKLSDVDKKKFEDMSPEDREKWWQQEQNEDAHKRLASDPVLKSLHDRNAELEKRDREQAARIQKLEDERELAICKADAKAMGLRDDDAGDMLMKARRGDKAAISKLEGEIARLNKSMAEVSRTGVVFAEFGKRTERNGPASAHDEITAKADELRKADPKLTKEQAYAKALEQNPELSRRESEERLRKIQGLSA